MAYQGRMVGLVGKLLEILALGLPKEWNCPSNVFESLLEKPSIPMRFLHYSPVLTKDSRQFGGKNMSPVKSIPFTNERILIFICSRGSY